jgi:RES domain
VKTVKRAGRYFRVCDPVWADCCDASFAARHGGRWNVPGSFPVLYLSADVDTAKMNAQRVYEGEAFGLYDLNPTARPHLQIVTVKPCEPVDAVTDDGLAALGLPTSYPTEVGHSRCQPVGLRVRDDGGIGIAYQSAARPGGEELALIQLELATKHERLAFTEWYEK